MSQPGPYHDRSDAARFTLHQVIDRQHQGVVAYVFEYPSGWQVQSSLTWNFEHMSFPVTSSAQASSPDGSEAFAFHPLESFCWLQPDVGFYQQGQRLLGQTYLPPMTAADALTRWCIPRLRGDRPGLTVTGIYPMPLMAERLGVDLGGAIGEGIGVAVAYTEDGRAIEEEFYGITVSQPVPYTGPLGTMSQINWGFVRLFSFWAEQGRLDPLRGMFWHIARSVKVNPQWQQLYAQVMQQLQAQFNQYIQMGYSQIQAAGQLSQAISTNNDAMLSLFEQQRQAALRSSASSASSPSRSPTDSFSEYIRGVETLEDPYWGESQQEYTYQYHWTDGFGNYQHSNDAFFNPNIGSSQNWTLMEPLKRD